MELERNDLSLQIDTEITKLFYLSLLINKYSKRCVQFQMNGHVYTLEISVTPTKKDIWTQKPIKSELSFDNTEAHEWHKDSEDRLKWLKGRLEFLEEICKEDKIRYDWCDPVKDIVSYEF